MPTNEIASVDGDMSFARRFEALSGHQPMPWQEAVYTNFCAGDFSRALLLPTGLGKTSVIHLWLLALISAPERVPRRLVYVVNRRTIVDQATLEAEKLRRAITNPESSADSLEVRRTRILIRDALRELCSAALETPLAISTLRGQFADNGEWLMDPARPAIILGTVDMIGSRLLFSAYGRGFKSKPLHAGLLGQNSLCVHDEAHLENPFQELLDHIHTAQKENSLRPMRVMPLTATPRGEHKPLGLSDADLRHPVVRKRLLAKKRLVFHEIDKEKELTTKVAELALAHRDGGCAVLIFLRKPEDVRRLAAMLPEAAVKSLTGTQRGVERDELIRTPIFQRFLPDASRCEEIQPAAGTVYLISTSAGEVGVDISADHLVCDLTPLDSMAQRLGRVNRYGDGDARVDIVHSNEFDSEVRYDVSREKTLELLRKLNGDGSPNAIRLLPPTDCIEAYSPSPAIVPLTDVLVDAWALTTVRDQIPGRPPVADWLHGVQSWEPSETYVAWRDEVEFLSESLLSLHPPSDVLDDYPLKPHELLRDRTDRVHNEIKKLAGHQPNAPAWVVTPGQTVWVGTLAEVAGEEEEFLEDKIVILPPSAGGLRHGMLDATSREADDVSDLWFGDEAHQQRRRERQWSDSSIPVLPDGMRLVRSIEVVAEESAKTVDSSEEAEQMQASSDETPRPPPGPYWHWYALPRSADDDGSRFSRVRMGLSEHLDNAERHARKLVTALRLSSEEADAVVLAAKYHDIGKRRLVWQRSIGNSAYVSDPSLALAKSGARMRPLDLGAYRHEFGTLLDLLDGTEAQAFEHLSEHVRDLVLHLIAAHHGRARPHFPASEAFDPERPEEQALRLAADIPDRFVRLQRRYGHWGLAYLESLVRAADALASGAGQ